MQDDSCSDGLFQRRDGRASTRQLSNSAYTDPSANREHPVQVTFSGAGRAGGLRPATQRLSL